MRGFTLIEIMIVVVIVGLLASFGGHHIIGSHREAQRRIARTKCKEYYDAAHLWQMQSESKRLPRDLDEMCVPLRPGERRFLMPVSDPWGNPYVLAPVGSDVQVRSWGEDLEEGTDDDLVWPEE
jgi:general secretion pathway protein G